MGDISKYTYISLKIQIRINNLTTRATIGKAQNQSFVRQKRGTRLRSNQPLSRKFLKTRCSGSASERGALFSTKVESQESCVDGNQSRAAFDRKNQRTAGRNCLIDAKCSQEVIDGSIQIK